MFFYEKHVIPALMISAGISSKWEVARGPGYQVDSGMTYGVCICSGFALKFDP